jgi:hypothetical protein
MDIARAVNKHRFDETMVIAVMVFSALGILLILSSQISTTGQAIGSAPNEEMILGIMHNSQKFTGTGSCNDICLEQKSICVLALRGDQLRTCEYSSSKEMSCLCAKVN